MSISLDDFDVEAAFEEELARVKLEDSGSDGYGSSELQGQDLQGVSSSESEDGDCDHSEKREPASLQLLRVAIRRRERAAEDFGRDWERFCLEVARTEPSGAASQSASNLAAPGPSSALAETSSHSTAGGTTMQNGGAAAANTEKGGTSWLDGADPASVALGRPNDGAASGVPTERPDRSGGESNSWAAGIRAAGIPQYRAGGLNAGIDIKRPPPPLPVGHSSDGPVGGAHLTEVLPPGHPAAKFALQLLASPPVSRSMLNVSMRWQASAVLPRAMQAEAAAADVALRRREEKLEEHRRRALADLDEELARMASERQAQVAAAEAEQHRLAEETEAAYQRLDMARREAEERRALQEVMLAALRQEALDLARKHMAAWRIGRAWRRYRQGPARAARLAAAIYIQAAWRGHVGRRCVVRLRAQRAILEAVEEAAREGKADQLRTAVTRAQEIGLDKDVGARLAALDAAVGYAAAKLRATASDGTYSDYRGAQAAAQAFPSLAQLLAECNALFEERRAEAEAAVWRAVEEEPMPIFYGLIQSVAPLGIEPQQLTAAVEAVRQRDEQLTIILAAASRAQCATFNAVQFDALAERAVRLGLKGDAAAARLMVERRRRALAVALRTRGSAVSSAAECRRIAEEARRMGMAAEAEGIMQQLRGRQSEVQAAIGTAVTAGSASRVAILLQQACQVQVPVAVIQGFSRFLRDRQAGQFRALGHATACGLLHSFMAARGAAVHGGADLVELLAADSVMAAKRRAAALSLMQATGDILSTLDGIQPRNGYGLAGLLASVLRLGSARAVLIRAADRVGSGANHLITGPAAETSGSNMQVGEGTRQQQLQEPYGPGARPAHAPHTQHVQRAAPHAWVAALEKAPPDLGPASHDGGVKGRTAPNGSVGDAVATGWPCLISAVKLGLSDTVCLALCALDLHHMVQLATGSHSLLTTVVERDYWGVLSSPHHAIGAHAVMGAPAVRAGHGLGDCWSRGVDELLGRLKSLLRKEREFTSLRTWAPLVTMVVPNLPAATPPVSDSRRASARSVTQAAPAAFSGGFRAASGRSGLPAAPVVRSQESLIQAIILRNVPEAARALGAGTGAAGAAAGLRQLVRLDLGLERLTSLKGLESWCPSLRALSADANRLSSLEGLVGLAGLQELSLKQNQLVSLLRQSCNGGPTATGLPVSKCLRHLALDSNKLSGPLRGLAGCGGLRTLSLAHNAITDIGAELEACAPVLTSLCLRGNMLTSLQAHLVVLTCLRDLDVSGNRLTSLEGIQGLLMLQTLHASSNEIAALPQHLCLPHLTSLDLGQNALSAFPYAGGSTAGSPVGSLVLPALQRLVLQENRISLLGPFGPMQHLTLLDLSFNQLHSLDALHALVHLSSLRNLRISSNPVTDSMPSGPNVLTRLGLRAAPPSVDARQRDGWSLTAITEWAMPVLRELNNDEVNSLERVSSTVRAAAVSPACAVAGKRQLKAAGACYVVHHTPAATATAAYGRHLRTVSVGRSAAFGRVARQPLVRFAGELDALADPASVRSLLIASTAGPAFGSAALCGLHAEMAAAGRAGGGRLGETSSGSRRAQSQSGAGCSTATSGEGQPTAVKWLSRVERLWHFAGPSEALELHARQLVLAQSLRPRAASAWSASADTSGLKLLEVIDSASRSAAVLQHSKTDLLDLVAVRCLRPAARFVGCPAFAGASNGECQSTAAQHRRCAQASDRGGTASWAVGAEAHGRFEAATAQVGCRFVEELRQLCHERGAAPGAGLCTASTQQLPLFFTVRPSYFHGRMLQDAREAATRMQAFWRGACVRRALPLLRLRAANNKASRLAAVIMIQAWWRGHCVRRARLLLQMRQEDQRRRLEARRREAAAVTIQAHFRGHLIRKHLRAALAAARGPPGFRKDSEPDLHLMDSGELDNMLQGLLSPIEKLLGEEDNDRARSVASFSSADVNPPWLQPQQLPAQQQQLRNMPGIRLEPEAGHGTTVLAEAHPVLVAAAWPGGLSAHNTQQQWAWQQGIQTAVDIQLAGQKLPLSGSLTAIAPSMALVSSESAALYPAAMGPRQSSDEGRHPGTLTTDFSSLEQFHAAKGIPLLPPVPGSLPAGLLPPISVRSPTPQPAGLASARARPSYDSAVEHLSPQSLPEGMLYSPGLRGQQHSMDFLGSEPTDGDQSVPVLDTASVHDREERCQRHMQRMQKLMAEWGFKDLATAEAYYRRALRQKQGHTRRNGQGKYPDHAQRRPMPQPRVDPRQEAGGAGEQPAGGARPPLGMRQRAARKPSTMSSAEESSGNAAVPQRNLNSADGVLVGGSEHPAAAAGMISRSGSTPRSGGRQILAPLGSVSVIKQPCKAVIPQRPHHLPALASNNWFALNPQPEMLGTQEGNSALHVGGHAAIKPGTPGTDARPGTVQSVDSTPEVILL